MKSRWLFGYVVGLALALGTRSPAPLVLAVGIPGAFALLHSMRSHSAFPFWTIFTVAGTLGFWMLSGSGFGPAVLASFVVTAVAGAFFFRAVRDEGKLRLFLGLLSVFAMLVGFFSSGVGGAGSMLAWLIARGYSDPRAHLITLCFRKTVHFTFYGTVGWAALQAARQATDEPLAAVRTALLAAVSLASFDELRQSGYTSRTGTPWDVLLDFSGAAVFVGLSEWLRRKGR
jgi:VanZ family protein